MKLKVKRLSMILLLLLIIPAIMGIADKESFWMGFVHGLIVDVMVSIFFAAIIFSLWFMSKPEKD